MKRKGGSAPTGAPPLAFISLLLPKYQRFVKIVSCSTATSGVSKM